MDKEEQHGQYWWASFCSAHIHFEPTCDTCHYGSWVMYTSSEARSARVLMSRIAQCKLLKIKEIFDTVDWSETDQGRFEERSWYYYKYVCYS